MIDEHRLHYRILDSSVNTQSHDRHKLILTKLPNNSGKMVNLSRPQVIFSCKIYLTTVSGVFNYTIQQTFTPATQKLNLSLTMSNHLYRAICTKGLTCFLGTQD